MTPTSRREFLAATSTAAVAASFAGGVHAAGGDTLKVGLVGCGGRGTGAAVNALKADPNVKLTAMADAFADRLESSLGQISKGHGPKVDVPEDRRFSGFDACAKLLQTDVDLVILATPPHFRPEHLKLCLDAKKHVFCEKPIAVDAAGVRSVIQTAKAFEAAKLSLVSGFCYRYDLAKRETVKRIHDGAIGDVVTMQINYNTGPIWHKGRDPKWSEMEYQMRNWYYFTWLSGDHIVEQHVHNFDKAAWVFKGEMPVAAVGVGGRQQRTDPKYGNIYDHHAVTFEYANGARLYSFCRQQPHTFNDVSDHVFGTKGKAELMSHVIKGPAAWEYQGEAPNMYQVEHDELFAAIRAGKILNDGVSAAYSTMMSIMGRMATYSGQRVTWDFAMNESKESLVPPKYEWADLPPELSAIAVPGATKLV